MRNFRVYWISFLVSFITTAAVLIAIWLIDEFIL
jgi:hypothetical protein